METTYFVLGMLSIIGAITLATIVWGVVKITKLLKAIKQHEEHMANNERNVWDNISHLREDLNRRIDEFDRSAHMRIDYTNAEIHRAINDQITDAVTQSNSYTDKRIDKLIDGYFENKKLIKG